MWTGAVFAGLWLGIAPPAAAPPERLTLHVIVYEFAPVSPSVLDGAREVVSRAFRDIDVDIRWSTGAELTRTDPADSAYRRDLFAGAIQVRLISPAMLTRLKLKPNALGSTSRPARMSWISVADVQASAVAAGVNERDALGWVMAHEIGHVLLPPDWHSVVGLMREMLDSLRLAHNQLFFLDTEAALIRQSLARRH